MRGLQRWVVTVLACLLAPAAALAFPIPEFTPNVVDPDGYLDARATQTVNTELQRIREESRIWGAVLIVGTLDGEPIENVAVAAFEKWQLGRQGVDNGLLLVLAMQDRESRFEVGYGLEGAIPDVVALRALDAYLAPRMRAGDTAGAIVDAFSFLSRVVVQDPDAMRELTESQPDEEFDWNRGLIAWGVFVVAVWLCLPLRDLWSALWRARLRRLEPSLLVDNEAVASGKGSQTGLKTRLFLQCFLSINPGVFVFFLSAAFALAFFISMGAMLLVMVLVPHSTARKYRSPARYREFLEKLERERAELMRKGHLTQRAPGVFDYTPAYHASRASSSSSSSSSSRSSSSSGGGRSGGGGASSRW